MEIGNSSWQALTRIPYLSDRRFAMLSCIPLALLRLLPPILSHLPNHPAITARLARPLNPQVHATPTMSRQHVAACITSSKPTSLPTSFAPTYATLLVVLRQMDPIRLSKSRFSCILCTALARQSGCKYLGSHSRSGGESLPVVLHGATQKPRPAPSCLAWKAGSGCEC